MKSASLTVMVISLLCAVTSQSQAQGYIVPNGVTFIGYQPGFGYEIDVVHDPVNFYSTGFFLNSNGANMFQFSAIVDVSVRVFLVSANDLVSMQQIQSQAYAELSYPNTYHFADGVPFYLGLYTGNQSFYPPDGIYSDPLFGWVELVNNQGVIQMLDGALEYHGAGIYAGTQNIINVPEPEAVALSVLGCLLFGLGHLQKRLAGLGSKLVRRRELTAKKSD